MPIPGFLPDGYRIQTSKHPKRHQAAALHKSKTALIFGVRRLDAAVDVWMEAAAAAAVGLPRDCTGQQRRRSLNGSDAAQSGGACSWRASSNGSNWRGRWGRGDLSWTAAL